MSLLEVSNLSVSFETQRGMIRPVNEVSFSLGEGETLGIVGESGSGKSLTSLAVMGLLPPEAAVTADRIAFQGEDLLQMTERNRRRVRGGNLSMIFQDPMSSLNPSFTVGFQIMEVLKTHQQGDKASRQKRAVELMERVGIPDPAERLKSYPHELSGGMCQRVMIAIAVACRPTLLIADEPTTALDVTIQAQILGLLKEIQEAEGMALVLITHDLAVVSQTADRVAVMYAGQVVEEGPTVDLIRNPRHPYTESLLKCLPGTHTGESKTRLPSIPGLVPDLANRPRGCQLHPRCPYAVERCHAEDPALEAEPGRHFRCFFPVRGGMNARP